MNIIKEKRFFVIGSQAKGALEYSYINAFRELNLDLEVFDPVKEQRQYLKGGKVGRMVHAFLPVEQWTRKMNRELILSVKKFNPEIILLFTNVKVLPGTLACIKTMLPTIKIAWIWPDTPFNLETHNFLNAALIDITASYSKAAVPVFARLGFKNIHWVPLAGDPFMHGIHEPPDDFASDICFIGGWRPEREKMMSVICQHFAESRIEIHGPNWKKKSEDSEIRKRVKSEGVYEAGLAKCFNKSRININVIDDTNYPAANMRFFEIPTAFGLQVSSACPEQEHLFRDREHALYFQSESDLVNQVKWALSQPEECQRIRKNAHSLLMESNTYTHRLQMILYHI